MYWFFIRLFFICEFSKQPKYGIHQNHPCLSSLKTKFKNKFDTPLKKIWMGTFMVQVHTIHPWHVFGALPPHTLPCNLTNEILDKGPWRIQNLIKTRKIVRIFNKRWGRKAYWINEEGDQKNTNRYLNCVVYFLPIAVYT